MQRSHLLFRLTMVVIVWMGLLSAFVDAVGSSALGAHPGTYGVAFRLTTVPGILAVTANPGAASPARGQLCSGDRLALGATPIIAFSAPSAGSSVRLAVDRSGERCRGQRVSSKSSATLVAVPDGPRPFDIEWGLIRILTLAVALLIALAAQPNDRTARALGTFLACLGLLTNWKLYPGGWALAGFFARDLAMIYGFPYFVVFAARFSSSKEHGYTPKLFGIGYEHIAAGLAVVFAAGLLAKDVLYLRAQYNVNLDRAMLAAMVSAFVLGLAALLGAVRRVRGEWRQKLWWVIATMGVSLSGAVAWLAMDWLELTPSWRDPLALTTILLPIGLSYAILRHHVLDITFALNRAIVFTILTLALVPFFGLIEWVLNELVRGGGLVKNPGQAIGSFAEFFSNRQNRIVAYANAFASVAVFTSLRYVHERVDQRVKKFMFRDRDRTLAALAECCREIMGTSGPPAAAQFLVDVFDEKLRVSGTTVYLFTKDNLFERAATSSDGAPDSIKGDDRAILRIKATDKLVALDELESPGGHRRTHVPGAYAIPIGSGPQLWGICAVPRGSSGRSLDSDELNAACDVARYAAYALEDFKVRDLETQLSELRRQA